MKRSSDNAVVVARPDSQLVRLSRRLSNTRYDKFTSQQKTHVLIAGIDSLYINLYGAPQVWLRSEHTNAVSIGGFVVTRVASSDTVKLICEKKFTVCVYTKRPMYFPVATIQFHAPWLRQAGLSEVAKQIAEISDAVLQSERRPPQVSRIDVYADLKTDIDVLSLPEKMWITLAKTRKRYDDGKQVRFGSSRTKSVGGSLYFGLGGSVMLRIYNKVEQLQVCCDHSLLSIWRSNGWDGVSRVFRVEFQLRRKAISKFGITEFCYIQDRLGFIWGYATQRWLRLAIPGKTKSRTRWLTHELWQEVQRVSFYGISGRSPCCLPRGVSSLTESGADCVLVEESGYELI